MFYSFPFPINQCWTPLTSDRKHWCHWTFCGERRGLMGHWYSVNLKRVPTCFNTFFQQDCSLELEIHIIFWRSFPFLLYKKLNLNFLLQMILSKSWIKLSRFLHMRTIHATLTCHEFSPVCHVVGVVEFTHLFPCHLYHIERLAGCFLHAQHRAPGDGCDAAGSNHVVDEPLIF